MLFLRSTLTLLVFSCFVRGISRDIATVIKLASELNMHTLHLYCSHSNLSAGSFQRQSIRISKYLKINSLAESDDFIIMADDFEEEEIVTFVSKFGFKSAKSPWLLVGNNSNFERGIKFEINWKMYIYNLDSNKVYDIYDINDIRTTTFLGYYDKNLGNYQLKDKRGFLERRSNFQVFSVPLCT